MVKVTGPMLSFDASGKIGGTAVFSKWKGRNYVRRLVKPSNPKSGGQTGMRAMFKFLAQQWASIGSTPQASWQDLADAKVVSPFNAFMGENQAQHRNAIAASQAYPAARVMTVDALNTFTATGGVRQITIDLQDAGVNLNNWGVMLYRSTSTGFTPSNVNLIAVILDTPGSPFAYVDTPLDPDTYYYDAKVFTTDGVFGALDGEINATAT